MEASAILNDQVQHFLTHYGLLPWKIEVSADVAADLYHFRPEYLNGVDVVIDSDLLPRRALSHYRTADFEPTAGCDPDL